VRFDEVFGFDLATSQREHRIKISWPHQVFVSKNFKVTGAIG
jgi:hypothetical protein